MVQNVTPASSAITTQVRTDVPAPPTVAPPWNPQHHSREYPLHRSLHHRLPPTRTTHLIHHIPRTKPPTPVGNVVGKIIKLKSVEKRYIVNIVNRRDHSSKFCEQRTEENKLLTLWKVRDMLPRSAWKRIKDKKKAKAAEAKKAAADAASTSSSAQTGNFQPPPPPPQQHSRRRNTHTPRDRADQPYQHK